MRAKRQKAKRKILAQRIISVMAIIVMLGVMFCAWWGMALFDFPKWAGTVEIMGAAAVISLVGFYWEVLDDEEGAM